MEVKSPPIHLKDLTQLNANPSLEIGGRKSSDSDGFLIE